MNLYEVHSNALTAIDDPDYKGHIKLLVEKWFDKLKDNQKITITDVEKYWGFVDFYNIKKEDGSLVYIDLHDNDDKQGFYIEDWLFDFDIPSNDHEAHLYQFFSEIYDLDKMQLLDIQDSVKTENKLMC